MSDLEKYFEELEEPHKSSLLYIRKRILDSYKEMSLLWKWKTPFFYYKSQPLCYFGYDKKSTSFYLGFFDGFKLEDNELLSGSRTRIKVWYFDSAADIHVNSLERILQKATSFKNKSLT